MHQKLAVVLPSTSPYRCAEESTNVLLAELAILLGDLRIYRTLLSTLDLFASEFSESVDDERLRLTP